MKVVKFGGTSVANSMSLLNVIDIVKESNDRKILIVSALGGITNLLDEMSTQASKGERNYKDKLQILENQHLDLIEFFIPVTRQSEIISFLKSQINELEEVLESLFTLNELTSKSLAKILSFGEILSSTIIYSVLKHKNVILN